MNVKLPFRALIALSVVMVAIFAVIAVFGSVGGGNICNEGCALDAKCSGDTPYLCQKSWGVDTCVAKGFDGGYCGGKTDKGGYCFECSGGCVAQSELGEKCGLFTTCGPDEYCCRRAEWYKSNTCKPKYADMGCCGGPPVGGDRTTYLKINIGNNKPDACTDKVKWEVKAKGASDFVDYSPECVEGSPDIKIESGTSMALSCTSQTLPTAATGPHTARVSWCGESKEFEYGASCDPGYSYDGYGSCKSNDCVTLIDNGNPADKLDIVFLGCNYTAGETSTFESDVNGHINKLFSVEPFLTNKNKINVHIVNRPDSLICYREGMCIKTDITEARKMASVCPNDEIIVLANTSLTGGCAYLGSGLAKASRSYPWVTVHEFGHSFGGLMDEYKSYGYAATPDQHPNGPNCDESPTCSKWAGTPEDEGCYGGCSADNWYRPSDSSIMVGIGDNFNKVSIKALDEKLGAYK